MTTPSISALPTPPSRSMAATAFIAAADAWNAAMVAFQLQANALAAGCDADAIATAAAAVQTALDRAATTSAAATAIAAAAGVSASPVTPATSNTANTIASSGSVAFTLVETGKAFAIGQVVKCTSTADITRYIIGTITAFAGVNMTISAQASGGSGSVAAWTIALIPPLANAFAGGTTITGSNKQNVVAMPALDVDLTAADGFTKTISANSTFTFSGATAATMQAFVLELTISGGAVPTWPGSVGWGGGANPSATLGNGRHQLIFVTLNGGTNWTASVRAKAIA